MPHQDKAYQKACKTGLKVFQKFRNDEEFVSLYAFSCLNADQIDRLAIPISILKNSEEARSNAAYFSWVNLFSGKEIERRQGWPVGDVIDYRKK